MGKWQNYEVERAFKLIERAHPPEVMTVCPSHMSQRWYEDKFECKSYGKQLAKNTGRQEKHLRKCKAYLEEQIAIGNSNPIARVVEAYSITTPHQTTLNNVVRKLNKAEKLHLDLKAAALCFEGGLVFTQLQTDVMKELCFELNPAFKPPSRQYITGHLLNLTYASLKEKVDKIIVEMPFVNVITDGSTNINNTRISNISIHSRTGSFYYLSQDIGTLSMTAVNQANWLLDHLRTISKSNLQRVNSISMDTCPTMFATWAILMVVNHICLISLSSHFLSWSIVSLSLAIRIASNSLSRTSSIFLATKKFTTKSKRSSKHLSMHRYSSHVFVSVSFNFMVERKPSFFPLSLDGAQIIVKPNQSTRIKMHSNYLWWIPYRTISMLAPLSISRIQCSESSLILYIIFYCLLTKL